MKPCVYIGTSGYSYKSWDKTFYGDTPRKLQLEFYATRFPTVEINATFYRLPSERLVVGWRDRVPSGFRYAIKGSRFITHMKKLADVEEGLDRFFAAVAPLKSRIAVVLWQLPRVLRKDGGRLARFLENLPREYSHALEFREPSWYSPEIFTLMRRHGVAHVALSSGAMPRDLTVTARMIYIRFHGLEGGAAHNYTRDELRPWAKFMIEQAAKGKQVYAYFNNDVNVRAPENARMLMEMVGNAAAPPLAREQPRFPLACVLGASSDS